jgi:hypothetical protein
LASLQPELASVQARGRALDSLPPKLLFNPNDRQFLIGGR